MEALVVRLLPANAPEGVRRTFKVPAFLIAAFTLVLLGPIISAFWLRSNGSAVIIGAWALPLCLLGGVRFANSHLVRAYFCWSGTCTVIFGIVAAVLVNVDRKRYLCICDPACTDLPALPSGPAGGGNQNQKTLPELREEPRFVFLCAQSASSVSSAYTAYVATGAIAFILAAAACVFACRMSRAMDAAAREAAGAADGVVLAPYQQVYLPGGVQAIPVAVAVPVAVYSPGAPVAVMGAPPPGVGAAPPPVPVYYSNPVASTHAKSLVV